MSNIVAIAGSPSHPSRSYSVLERVKSILEEQQLTTEIISVRNLPPEGLVYAQFGNPAIQAATAKVTQADGVIIATPVYKVSYTGVLKAFLDLLPQEGLRGKPVLPIATGGTIAHLLSIDYALKPVLNALGARYILGGVYIVDTQIQIQADGSTKLDEETEQRLHTSLQDFSQAVQAHVPAAVSVDR